MVEWEKSGKTKAVKEHAAKPHKILVFATPVSPKKGWRSARFVSI